MKRSTLALALALTAAFAAAPTHGAPFSYHGELMDGEAPAEGAYDLRVRAFASAEAKAALGEATELPGVVITDGRFALELELADNPLGDTWVEVAIRKSGSDDDYETLGAPQAATKANTGCWALDGNTGVPVGGFLGIADPNDTAPLELRARNVRVARFSPGVAAGPNAGAAATVLGSNANSATSIGATVAGGGATHDNGGGACPSCANVAVATFASVGGGKGNYASGPSSTIAGGNNNMATGDRATISGGNENDATALGTTVAGGNLNQATALNATVGGGALNQARGAYATVPGGEANIAAAAHATVAGGRYNCAGGEYSFAAGFNASVRDGTSNVCAAVAGSGDADGDEGAFVWADSGVSEFVSTGPDQFLIRAAGGIALNSNALMPYPNADLLVAPRLAGDADVDLQLLTRGGRQGSIFLSNATGGWQMNAPNRTAGSNFLTVDNGASLSSGGVWTNASSRELKEAFAGIDAGDILARVVALPITTWQYKASTEGRHLGPVAEDFKQAFGLAGDGTAIPTVDADGVALAAIQGLNAKLETENTALREQLDAVLARLSDIEARLER